VSVRAKTGSAKPLAAERVSYLTWLAELLDGEC
jgi:hypothetical protein